MKRYEALIQLYLDKKSKTPYKSIFWYFWAENEERADVIVNLEGKALMQIYQFTKFFYYKISLALKY